MLTALAGGLVTASLVSTARRQRASARASALAPVGRRRHDHLQGALAVLERALARADVAIDAADALTWWLAADAAVAVVAWSSAGARVAVPALAGGLVAGPAALVVLRHRHEERLREAVPDLLDDVAGELRAGGSVAGALERRRRRPGPLGREAAVVMARVELGLTLDEALAGWAASYRDTVAHEAVATAAVALRVAAGAGGRSAGALGGMAAAFRDEASALAEARAQASQGRVSAVILGALPVGSLVLTTLFDPDALAVVLNHPLGRATLLAGLVLDAVGLTWMRRIVRVTP